MIGSARAAARPGGVDSPAPAAASSTIGEGREVLALFATPPPTPLPRTCGEGNSCRLPARRENLASVRQLGVACLPPRGAGPPGLSRAPPATPGGGLYIGRRIGVPRAAGVRRACRVQTLQGRQSALAAPCCAVAPFDRAGGGLGVMSRKRGKARQSQAFQLSVNRENVDVGVGLGVARRRGVSPRHLADRLAWGRGARLAQGQARRDLWAEAASAGISLRSAQELRGLQDPRLVRDRHWFATTPAPPRRPPLRLCLTVPLIPRCNCRRQCCCETTHLDRFQAVGAVGAEVHQEQQRWHRRSSHWSGPGPGASGTCAHAWP